MPPFCKFAIVLSNLRNYHRGDAQYQFFQSLWCFLLAAPVMARVWRQTDFLYNGLAKFMWILFTVPVYWIKEAVIHPPLRVFVRMAVIQLNFEVTFCKCYAYVCLLIAHNISQGLAIRDEDLCLGEVMWPYPLSQGSCHFYSVRFVVSETDPKLEQRRKS
jgi:hypothetical protein